MGVILLKLKKTLDIKTIPGKKYRSPIFSQSLITFIVVFAVTLIISAITIPDTYKGGDRAVLVGLLCVVCSALPFAMTVCSRAPVCALADDKLYFFHCEVTRYKSTTGISESTGYTNGSLLYSDIKVMEFLRMEYSRRVITPSRIVVRGDGFSVTVFAYRSLIKKINEKTDKPIAVNLDGQNEPIVDEKPQGLWGDVLAAFENGKFETMWSSDVSVEYCSLNIDGDMIDITLDKNGAAICFNMDKDSIFVCYPPSDKEESLPLAHFSCIDELFSYMRKCADSPKIK